MTRTRWTGRRRPGRGAQLGAAAALLLAAAATAGASGDAAATSLTRAVPPTPPGAAVTSSATPSVAVSPTEAGAPSAVTVSVSGFNPQGSLVTCGFTAGTPASTTHLTVFTDGTAAGALDVTSSDALGTNPIECTEDAPGGSTLSATATFRVTDVATACPTSPATSATAGTCSIGQVLATTVSGTDLTIGTVEDPSPAGGDPGPTGASVVLSPVALGGRASSAACEATPASAACGAAQFAVSSGHLDTVVVEDNRGDLSGWTVTGQMATTFVGPPVGEDHVIPASFLTWSPSVGAGTPTSCVTLGSARACGPSDNLTQIDAGPTANLLTGTSRLLCQAATGGGGGGTRCTAALYLAVPPYVAAGRYVATMDIVIS